MSEQGERKLCMSIECSYTNPKNLPTTQKANGTHQRIHTTPKVKKKERMKESGTNKKTYPKKMSSDSAGFNKSSSAEAVILPQG